MIDARDFDRAARALERHGFERVAGRHVAKALKQGSNAVRRNVRAKAKRHRKTGTLNRNVRVFLRNEGLALEAKVKVVGMVAPMIAGGTSPHEISPVRGEALALHAPGRAGRLLGFASVVHHPGTKPDPFFREGVRASRTEIQQFFSEAASAMVGELVTRMRSKR